MRAGDFDLAGEVILHQRHRVGAEIEIAYLPHIPALDVADDHGCIVGRDQAEEFLGPLGAGQIQDVRSGFQAGAGDGRLIGLDGDQDS